MAKRLAEIKRQAAQDFLSGEPTLHIGRKYGVNEKTVRRWAQREGWIRQRKIVELPPTKPRDELPQIDELRIVDCALADLSELIGNPEVDPRVMASVATALCKLIELRMKIKPRTATQLVEMAIEMGVKPQDFIAELRGTWNAG
jgi:Putative ATPase subunit of terminase (gpP-like)